MPNNTLRSDRSAWSAGHAFPVFAIYLGFSVLVVALTDPHPIWLPVESALLGFTTCIWARLKNSASVRALFGAKFKIDGTVVRRSLLVAVSLFLLIDLFLVGILSLIFHLGPGETQTSLRKELNTITGSLSLMVAVAIVGPLSEELFFRGLLFQGLLQWGHRPAVIGSAAAFALYHFTGFNVPSFLAVTVAALFGLVYGQVFLRRKNLAEPILVHSFINISAITVWFFSTP